MRILILSLCMLMPFAGCSSTCQIMGTAGAAVDVDNGEQKGIIPCTISLSDQMFSASHQLRVTKDGYQTELRTISKEGGSFVSKPAWPGQITVNLVPNGAPIGAAAVNSPALPAAPPPSTSQPAAAAAPASTDNAETKFCESCGQRIKVNATFCSKCGAKQQ